MASERGLQPAERCPRERVAICVTPNKDSEISMKTGKIVPFVTVLVVLGVLGFAGYAVFLYSELVVRVALAEEQTEIFEEMVVKASAALSQTPPDVNAAIESLAYAHHYYPSGTKQVADSRLDRIVERTRTCAEQRVIDMLEQATGERRGRNAEAWIAALGQDGSAIPPHNPPVTDPPDR